MLDPKGLIVSLVIIFSFSSRDFHITPWENITPFGDLKIDILHTLPVSIIYLFTYYATQSLSVPSDVNDLSRVCVRIQRARLDEPRKSKVSRMRMRKLSDRSA